jgi:hypothetical protein
MGLKDFDFAASDGKTVYGKSILFYLYNLGRWLYE